MNIAEWNNLVAVNVVGNAIANEVVGGEALVAGISDLRPTTFVGVDGDEYNGVASRIAIAEGEDTYTFYVVCIPTKEYVFVDHMPELEEFNGVSWVKYENPEDFGLDYKEYERIKRNLDIEFKKDYCLNMPMPEVA